MNPEDTYAAEFGRQAARDLVAQTLVDLEVADALRVAALKRGCRR